MKTTPANFNDLLNTYFTIQSADLDDQLPELPMEIHID
jgi:hypothetical protein